MAPTSTGGAYSLFRALLGVYLFVHFAALLPWGAEVFSARGVLPNLFWISSAPAFVSGVLLAAMAASVALALGWRDRAAALLLWLVWASLFARNPLFSNPGLIYVGLLLVMHALQPPAPYGSLAARGRVDPGNGWRPAPWLFGVLWILMAAGYSSSGFTKLESAAWTDGSALQGLLQSPLARPGGLGALLLTLPDALLRVMCYGALALQLLFAPLALIPRARPWLWLAMVGMHVGLILLIDVADLSLGMLLLHLATFDPAWVRARRAEQPERLFYDGGCGVCHGFVRFLLSEDPAGRAVRFAPLDSDSFRERVPAEQRDTLPDSVVLLRDDGALLTRSTAVIHILRALGGVWGALGCALACVPRSLRDAAYDGLARVRHRVAKAPDAACPLLPPELAARFEH